MTLVILIEHLLFQPATNLRKVLQIEFSNELGAFCATADKSAAAPFAKHEPQRVNEYGLASTSLAGQHRHAR